MLLNICISYRQANESITIIKYHAHFDNNHLILESSMLLSKKFLLVSFIFLLSACGDNGSDKSSDGTKPTKAKPLFSWAPISGATQYELGIEKQDGSEWKSYIQSAKKFNCQTGVCSFTPKDLGYTKGTKIKWWVKPYVEGSWGDWSKEKNTTIGLSGGSNSGGNTGATDTQAPSVPTKLRQGKAKSDSVNIEWNASSDDTAVIAYNIYRNNKYISNVTKTEFKDTDVVTNTNYDYTVTALDAAQNESLKSNKLSIKTEKTGHTGIDEPVGIYDTADNVLEMYVHIYEGSGTCSDDKYDGCTFGQVLNDLNWKDDFKPEVKVNFSTENGLSMDATFRQRGGHGRYNPMKSFRVKLSKNSSGKKVYWEGERRIQLLKTFDDFTRARHKLSYDLFAEIEHFPSMRSRYVRLKVEDKGSFSFERSPNYSRLSSHKETDMGLYLQVEYFGKEYLERRGWKKGSNIYKAAYFDFSWDSETQEAFWLDKNGKPVNEKAFDKKLEIKSGKDHREFINFMEAIHDTSNDFNSDVLGTYLDRNNYITWLAVNILTANTDTVAHNFYLYNPKDTRKFYFVPWDYDFTYPAPNADYPPYWYTHAFRWGNDLHTRFLEISSNVQALKQRVKDLRQGAFRDSNIRAKLSGYESAIAHIVTSSTDDQWDIYWQSSQSARISAYRKNLYGLAESVATNYNKFLKYFDSPMTFYMYTAKVSGGEFSMRWNEAVSLHGNAITYDLIISKAKDFNSGDILEEITGITSNKYRMSWHHGSGQYFVKVIARDTSDPQRKWQASKNEYGVKDSAGNLLFNLYGVNTFTVN